MKLFLQPSLEFEAKVPETFNFINTIRVAIDHIADQAQRLIVAGANDRVLEGFFGSLSGGTGQNIRQFTSMSASDREFALAETWLFGVIGHYEVWSDSLPWTKERGGQFPSSRSTQYSSKPDYKGGFGESFATLTPSPQMTSVYSTSVATDPDILSRSDIDAALLLYRFYKECRNSLAHRGGKASPLVADVGAEAQAVSSHLNIGINHTAKPIPTFVSGDPVRLGLSDVRVLVSLLLRIVKTIDAIILQTTTGETQWQAEWERQYGSSSLSVRARKLHNIKWLHAALTKASLPIPKDGVACVSYLLATNKVREIH